jgi:hypothetical protein
MVRVLVSGAVDPWVSIVIGGVMARVLVFGAVDPVFPSGQTKDYGVVVRVLASGAVDPGFPSPLAL